MMPSLIQYVCEVLLMVCVKSGRLVPGNPGHPRDVNGFSFICGLDPAMVGDTAVVCYAVDRATHKRYIVDAIKITRPTPAAIRQLIFDWTSLYSAQ